MTEDNNDQTDDTGLDDDMLPFGEEFNLSEQNFSEFVSDQVNPVIESEFHMKDFAASKDNGAESRFSESGILGKVVTFPDDDAGTNFPEKSLRRMKQPLMSPSVNFDFLSDTLVATPPVLFDRPSMARTPFPREKPQLEYNLASSQLPLGMITPTATHNSISSVSYQSQDRPASDGAAPRNEGQSCRCMQKGVTLLEEVENQTQNFDPTAIDSALAYHKGALETCFSMLRCYKCAVCIEIAMLLTLVANKLSQLCEKIVSQLSQQSQRLERSHTQQQQQAQGGWSSESEDGSRTDAPHRNVFLGNHEINSLMEWIQLMKGLITVQLKGLIDLAARMKGREPGLSGSQLTKLGNVEREVRKILGRLQGCEVRL